MSDILKIVIIGGESTGKSTLCEQLAAHYHTVWVNEFAREYLEHLGREYTQADLVEIAKGQLAMEEKQLSLANKFLFCDTDLHVLKVWSDYKYGSCDEFISDHIITEKYDAYILTSPDFPWEEDPLREHPEPELREYFFNTYLSMIKETGLPYCVVEGDKVSRLETAVTFTNSLRLS